MIRALFIFILALLLGEAPCPAAITGAGKPIDWFKSDEARRAADNTLTWQFESGAFPKNIDTGKEPCPADRKEQYRKSHWESIDNGATYTQVRILAAAWRATGEQRFAAGVNRGLTYLLKAQRPTGGWPQCFPQRGGYHDHITFNDDAMVNVMRLLADVKDDSAFDCVSKDDRRRAQDAFTRGVDCIVRCQIIVAGVRTGWCAQHDAVTLEPRPARSYEKVSISGGESARIVDLLMSIDKPNPAVRQAIIAACAWYEKSKLDGIRLEKAGDDVVVVTDAKAPPLWARFYDIETNKPIFCGRDGRIQTQLKDIEKERRTGYAWYGNWGAPLPRKLEAWKKKWPAEK